LDDARQYSRNNNFTIRYSNMCGCYHCLEKFKSDLVSDWVDEGDTALCPHCGIDSVIPDAVTEVTKKILRELNEKYF